MLAVENKHIAIDAIGRPYILGTSYRVKVIVIDHFFHSYSPEEICTQHYNALNPAQVHAALSYYYDHKEELDAQFKREDAATDELLATLTSIPARERLLKKTGLGK